MYTLANSGRICLDAWLTRTRQPARFRSAAVVAALETAWHAIRTRHREIPPAVIVVAGATTSTAKSHGLVLGHFAALRWQHHHQRLSEVFVSGEGLRQPATDVLTTLLHEAAHALAFARGIKDTSRQGRWHNHRFAACAAELGLHVTKDPNIGWSPSVLQPDTATDYAPVLADLARALTAYRHREPNNTNNSGTNDNNTDTGDNDSGEPKKPSSIACLCGCPRRIRLAPSVLDQGPITCGICDNEFTPDQ